MRAFGFGFRTVCAAAVILLAFGARGAEQVEPLVWDATTKECTVKPGEMQATTFFAVTNVSEADVVIMQVATSCGCTVASLPSQPWRLTPGTGGKITATLNLAGRVGTVSKTLTVISSAGNKVLTITANVPPPPEADPAMAARLRNQKVAAADRLATFRNNCAQCHLEPAFGKTGKALYADVCGVCHEAKRRAPMVADLRTVNVANNPEFWRAFIKHGKAGTMMPPFDQAEGGPLNDGQIDSLVAYLTTDLRNQASAAPPPLSARQNVPMVRRAPSPRLPLSQVPPMPPGATLTPSASAAAAQNQGIPNLAH